MTQDLSLHTDEGLRAACLPLEASDPNSPWAEAVAETIARVRAAGLEERSQLPFQRWLWNDNRIANVGRGSVRVDEGLADEGFRTWLAARSLEPCPSSLPERTAFLSALYTGIEERIHAFVERTPKLKIFRVLAALYPEAMTSLASSVSLRELSIQMGAPTSLDDAGRHAWVRARLDEVLGVPSQDPLAQARRLILPWRLHRRDGDSSAVPSAPNEQLVPWPASRRRRGMTSINGLFPGMLAILEFIGDGKPREELLDHLQEESPESKRSTLVAAVHGIQAEFGVIRLHAGSYVLTERGEALLESQDPVEVRDWLLTRVLGVDWLLVTLRDRGRLPSRELTAAIRKVNPGWTTNYQPSVIRGWIKSLGLIAYEDGYAELTATGREWASRVHWTPEALPPPEPSIASPDPDVTESDPENVILPAVDRITADVQRAGAFPAELIAQLHIGLWSHHRRHLAVLAGISGSGKTLLARQYGRALMPGAEAGNVLTLAVQPGWHDPSALLGYVNPLRSESYVRTPFLEFLLRASSAPSTPHVVILDEMNLSHPEQYMAPLLSAMETGDVIQLHQEDEYLDGVPAQVAYPPNLALIGTVNMDETTHGLSDKVLDRAFVLEFWDVDLDAYPRWGRTGLPAGREADVRAALRELMSALAPARLHFGWRVVDEVVDFLRSAHEHDGVMPAERALDHVLYGKVLPKLRGEDSPRFRASLDACAKVLEARDLSRCLAKVHELREELALTGSARFWR